MAQSEAYDLLIVGGGINGAGVARDAAGRGLRVALCEQGDLASATSSASSKLIHGGLRYLERYEFRLVAEALGEREVLLQIAPHLVTPLTFVLPWVPGMRPRWVLRIGLWLYDHLARRSLLPGAHAVSFPRSPLGDGLREQITAGFSYSDCWVDDARLVILNCRDAAARGALILPRTRMVQARRAGKLWEVDLVAAEGKTTVFARALVNAAGPWVRSVLRSATGAEPTHQLRLVKGSHIVTSRLYEGRHAFILQNDDGRVILVMPYREQYSLIGTTDIVHHGRPEDALISSDEIAYLCRAVNRYFRRQLGTADVVWSYSGVRPLFDDGAANPSEVTRDYRLLVDSANGPPLLSIYGGKITTYRRLAEHVLEKLQPWFAGLSAPWTAASYLPGGDLGACDASAHAERMVGQYPGLPADLVRAVAARHGSITREIFAGAQHQSDLGDLFGRELCTREVDHFMDCEWACSADDVLWRRTKAGLALDDKDQWALARYMASRGARHALPSVAMP